jgi:hypothetical protein
MFNFGFSHLIFMVAGWAVAYFYNRMEWKKYHIGMRHGLSMREWKEGTEKDAGRETRPLQRITRAGVKTAK